MIYDLLAEVYDGINGELDYSLWADFLERIFERDCAERPDLVLDLAAGTGRMTIELARRGYDMTAVDISAEMLDVARRTAENVGLDSKILWLCQDMTEFELYGTVDAVVCCLDSINHLTSPAELRRALDLVHNYLIPDGVFIFDVNGIGKFESTYADRSYVFENEGGMCIWQNDYNPRSRLCDFYITLFTEEDDGRYVRRDDIETERAYSLRSLKAALSKSGFEFIGAYSDFDFTPATDADERIYIVARCKK